MLWSLKSGIAFTIRLPAYLTICLFFCRLAAYLPNCPTSLPPQAERHLV
jgi:hypothetical protein